MITNHAAQVLGQQMTRSEIHARCAEINRDNALYGLSDGRVTEGNALNAALRELDGDKA